MYHLIVVPIDGTPFSQHALPYALSLAQRTGAAVELTQVVATPAAGFDPFGVGVVDPTETEALRETATARLRGLAEQAARRSGVAVSATVLSDGDTVAALVRHVRERRSDLVVMTTHDRSRLERWLLGRTAEQVTREVRVPVLLVRGHEELPTFEPLPSFRHVLVPLDGSPLASLVLPHVVALARATQARATLLAVIDPVLALGAAALPPADVGPGPVSVMEPASAGESETAATAVLDAAAEPLRNAGIPVDVQVSEDGQPARAILAEATRVGADVIAMSTHGRGALGRLVAGSVAEKVLHHALVPVLLYRPPSP